MIGAILHTAASASRGVAARAASVVSTATAAAAAAAAAAAIFCNVVALAIFVLGVAAPTNVAARK